MNDFEHEFYIGEWCVQPQKNLIIKNGELRRLENRLTRVLVCLARAAPDGVAKDDLINEVWPNKIVSDDTLSVAISQLRKALGCNAKQPRYIVTIPGFGFRLLEKVRSDVLPVAAGTRLSVVSTKFTAEIRRKTLPVAIVFSCAIILLVGYVFLHKYESKTDPLLLLDNPLYARAQYLIIKPSSLSDLKEALTLLKTVEKKEKENAHLLLSMGRALIAHDRFNEHPDINKIKGLYQRAISLDAELADAYYHLAELNLRYEKDQEAAESNIIVCLSLQPSHANAHAFYGRLLQAQGHFEAALKQYRIVQLLDPSFYSTTAITWVYNMARDYEAAEHELAKLYAINPNALKYHRSALLLYENRGSEERAYHHYRAAFMKLNYSESELRQVEQAFKTGGLRQLNYWLANVKKEQRNIGQGKPPLSMARYHAAAGEYDKALDYLELAKKQNDRRLLWLKVDPKYKGLRGLPRYEQLLRDYGHTLTDIGTTLLDAKHISAKQRLAATEAVD